MTTLPITVNMAVDTSKTSYQLGVNSNLYTIPLHSDMAFEIVDANIYSGAYEVTPTSQEQTLYTNNLLMADDVIIKAIPNNYGLITYNGSYIRVT